MAVTAEEFGDFLKTDLLDDIFPVKSDEVSVICPACGVRTGWINTFGTVWVAPDGRPGFYRLTFKCTKCNQICALVGARNPKWRFS